MRSTARPLRQSVLLALLLFVASMLAVTAYTLWRLRSDALTSGLEMAAMQSQRFEDFLTQSLQVTELVAANVLPQAVGRTDLRQTEMTFLTTLRRAPYLRSMSLLDANDRIVVSSNPANVGLLVATQGYLPPPTAKGGAAELLLIGEPWAGRDFAGGRASRIDDAVGEDAQSFIPVIRTLVLDGRRVSLLVALNPDYFINHIVQKLDSRQGSVDILRYDGTLLLSTDPLSRPGSLYDVSGLRLADVESGEFLDDSGAGQKRLTAFRVSRLYPLVLLTHVEREYALRHWWTEAKALLSVVMTALLAITLLSLAFYRRQRLLAEQSVEFERLQRINAMVFDSSTVAIVVADDDAIIISLNAEFSHVTGYHAEDLIGHSLFELLTDEGIATFSEKTARRESDKRGAAPGDSTSFELQLRCKDGALIWTEVHSTPERNAQGAITGYHRICRNITERKQMEDQVRQLAFHDQLTHLPNRRLLNDRLSQAMAASMHNRCHGALMFLDLDNFKSLNDLHGHGLGDLLLVEAAHRIKGSVREADTVARFGGDEFVVMLGVLSSDQGESVLTAKTVAEKIRKALAAPYRLPGGPEGGSCIEHRCTASIGVVIFLNHQVSQEQLIKWADAAMYQAKQAGSNVVRFHDQAAGGAGQRVSA
jgi:diguanylate cyclase (GGDEF)-like protein/PAS domain S-box-containing protein